MKDWSDGYIPVNGINIHYYRTGGDKPPDVINHGAGDDGLRTSGGVFSVSEEGYGYLEVSSEKPLFDYSEFGITTEPLGGSQEPTGEKVLGGEF